ncbi:COX15/CtaA family protein [Rubrolithibacter danxiaensis]|uniref:COX15/CtaA family protein n=1 Tax=Rubrolithibacter danxiaensis TaxID=3390805 RepID=UPI003BF8D634
MTILSLYVLILAGGVVRSSGAGMGCPDWPRCFDQVVPPTHASQLPKDYQDKYVQKRVEKNQRFAKSLDVLGFGKLASEIRNDKSILKPEEFNATKTWTEYVNRVIGVITGFLIILTACFSLTYLKSSKRIFFLSFLNVLLVGFQGWLGSIVVSTNLLAWLVTVHMLLALLILAIAIYTYFNAKILRARNILPSKSAGLIKIFAVLVLIITVIQIILGTEVRELIDMVSSVNPVRSEWLSEVGFTFNVHRDLAMLVVLGNIVLFFFIRSRYPINGLQYKYIIYVIVTLAVQIITGIILSYLSLPPVAQALHILLASLLFGSEFYLLLLLGRNKLYKNRY